MSVFEFREFALMVLAQMFLDHTTVNVILAITCHPVGIALVSVFKFNTINEMSRLFSHNIRTIPRAYCFLKFFAAHKIFNNHVL